MSDTQPAPQDLSLLQKEVLQCARRFADAKARISAYSRANVSMHDPEQALRNAVMDELAHTILQVAQRDYNNAVSFLSYKELLDVLKAI